MEGKTTEQLSSVLKSTRPENAARYFTKQAASLAEGEKPFAQYIRTLFREKEIRQQDVFLKADISENFGYKLISQEKHTRQRDLILRILLAAGLRLDETNRALKLYGMSPLYPRIKRDAVLIMAIHAGKNEIEEINAFLKSYGMEPLYSGREEA